MLLFDWLFCFLLNILQSYVHNCLLMFAYFPFGVDGKFYDVFLNEASNVGLIVLMMGG